MRILLVFVLFVFMCPLMSSAAQIDLPRTGKLTSYATGDDGDIRAGVILPDPRFMALNDGTVYDNLTGFTWLKDAKASDVESCVGGYMSWPAALSYIACINEAAYLGYTDWILPNINELSTLVDAEGGSPEPGHPFTNVDMAFYYWSSTTDRSYSSYAWDVRMDIGYSYGSDKDDSLAVWPMRATTDIAAPISIPKTGLQTSYAAGDDGDLERGVSWPEPRYTDHADGTVTDNLTGLIWLKDANCLDVVFGWDTALASALSLEEGSCGLSDGSAVGDWRLPNWREMISIVDREKSYPAITSGHPFANIQSNYWTSTPFANESLAWMVNLGYGASYDTYKTAGRYVWPVRGGSVHSDNDGIVDTEDNCPLIDNLNQLDSDNDKIGDACDSCPDDESNDSDSDGICGIVDNCPVIENADQSDSDEDGYGDLCDVCPDYDDNLDADNDGFADCLDTGDSDGDTFTDAEEVVCGSDPIDPKSQCSKNMPWLMLLIDE